MTQRNRLVYGLLLLVWVATPSVADTVTVDLEYRTDTMSWELYAQVIDTDFGNSGDNGIAALRALIDNVDFGTNGDAINLATGIGAVDPIDPGGTNERPAVVQTTGGTLDIIYVQNIAVPGSVVGGVGVGGRQLLMDGTFSSLVSLPMFGDDDNGFTTDGNFLDQPAPGPFGGALAFDGVALNALDVTPSFLGDYSGNDIVDAADYAIWRDTIGSTTALAADGSGNDLIDVADYDVWASNFGATAGGSPVVAVSTPEPAAWLLCLMVCFGCGAVRETRIPVRV